MTLIEEQRVEQLEAIQNNTRQQLALLAVKYSLADKCSRSFSFVSLTFIAIIYGSIIVNDLLKLIDAVLHDVREIQTNANIQENLLRPVRRDNLDDRELDATQIDATFLYSEGLDSYLERKYLQLVASVANKRNGPDSVI